MFKQYEQYSGFYNLFFRVVLSFTIFWIVMINFLDMAATVGYAQSKGVFMADITVPLAQAILGLSGLMILFGVMPRFGLLMFMGFLFVVTLGMHQWWTLTGMEQFIEMKFFQTNVMLFALAGLLFESADRWQYTLKMPS